MGDPLADAVREQLATVARRAGGRSYAHEPEEVRRAWATLHTLRERLRLETFVRSLNVRRGKPQLLLVFDRAIGDRVVIKIYGRRRPNESVVQGAWADHGVAVVPVLASGDEPTSWLLMPYVDGAPVSLPEPDSAAAHELTRKVAAEIGHAHTIDAPVVDRSPLGERLRLHYDATMGSLVRHGYRIPENWWELCAAEFDGAPAVLLHGDAAPANLLRGSAGLVLVDTCGYLGPAEFDAARWCARVGGWARAERLLSDWLSVETGVDPDRARRLLGCELLMEAGVREIRKDERRQRWDARDPWTLAAIDRGLSLLGRGGVGSRQSRCSRSY